MSKSKRELIEASGRDYGATMVEYALIVGAIALVAVVGAGIFGQGVLTLFDDISSAL